MTSNVVFLMDVDNTLLDNDRIVDDLRAHLVREFGLACSDRYWSIFEALRLELGYADYLGALQRFEDRPVPVRTGKTEFAHKVRSQIVNDPVVVEQGVVDIHQEHHVRGHRVPSNCPEARVFRGTHDDRAALVYREFG